MNQLWYATLPHLKRHPHTKYEIHNSNNMRYAPDTIILRTKSGQGQGYSDPKIVCDTKDASTHQIWNSYLKEYRRYAPDTKWDGRTFYYYKNSVRGQGQGDPKMVRDTPPSQDASTHQIWNSYLKEYRRYALDTKRDGWTDSAITICLPKFLWGHKNLHC